MNHHTSISFLQRVQTAERGAEEWQRFKNIYEPHVQQWLCRRGIRPQDAEDVRQDVMLKVVKELPNFEHNGRPGAFRHWLREVTRNCLKAFGRRENRAPRTMEGPDCQQLAEQLSDANSDMTQIWDKEHNLHVLKYLMKMIQKEFKKKTLQAFERVALKSEKVSKVAQDLGMTENAVRIAQHRVLTRLRELGAGLVD